MAKDQKKQPRPKAETPKGFRDYFGADVTERKAMLDRIAEIYHRHGFDPLETSAVETVEALGKFLPDVDRPNAGVFAWQEESVPGGGSGDWLALRYDLTAPLARVAAQFRNDLPSPYRRYAMGPVWRNEKPGPGRFRQFYQCDADTVGSASVAAATSSVAVAAVARLMGSPAIIGPVDKLLAATSLPVVAAHLVPPAAKIAVTPVTMYLNYLAMGVIIEQRIRFR